MTRRISLLLLCLSSWVFPTRQALNEAQEIINATLSTDLPPGWVNEGDEVWVFEEGTWDDLSA